MTFKFTLKNSGVPMHGLEHSMHGTREEGYREAKRIVGELAKLLPGGKFTCLIARTDKPAEPYEIDQFGHTING